MVRFMVTTDEVSQGNVIFPWQSSVPPYLNAYSFLARGLWFDVSVADEFPPLVKQACFVTSSNSVMFVGDRELEVAGYFQHFKRTAVVAEISQNLI